MRFFTRFSKIISIILVAVLLLLVVEPLAAPYFSPPPPLFFAREAHAAKDVGEFFFDLFKGLVNVIVEGAFNLPMPLPIKELIEAVMNGGQGAAEALLIFFEKALWGILNKFVKIPFDDLILVLLLMEQERIIHFPGGQMVELPAILVGGLALLIGWIIATAIWEPLQEEAFDSEVIALFVLPFLDIPNRIASDAVRKAWNAWQKDMEENRVKEHADLSRRVYKDGLGDKYGNMRNDLGGTSISYAGTPSAKFDEVNPGYRKTDGSYVDYVGDYKKIAENWANYVTAQNRAAQTEQNDFATLSKTITDLADASLQYAGYYNQAVEARAQTYAFAVQQTTNLRHDIARQIDVRARGALDSQQRRADLHAAFGRATKGGAVWPNGTRY
ncbi:MAG: hypothetical protein FWG71_08085 [Synergistaceae bacterium]|nr:hypothetical protein [Synergistaceae bacterium]